MTGVALWALFRLYGAAQGEKELSSSKETPNALHISTHIEEGG
jgi:hypothetical protein